MNKISPAVFSKWSDFNKKKTNSYLLGFSRAWVAVVTLHHVLVCSLYHTSRYIICYIVGFTRQLQYVHPSGGFSAFGPSDVTSSTWLTAFAVKHLRKAHEVWNIYIIMNFVYILHVNNYKNKLLVILITAVMFSSYYSNLYNLNQFIM